MKIEGFEGIDFVSLNDFLRSICFPNNPKASLSSVSGSFLNIISKYLYQNAPCYKADAEDKTKHILMDLDLLLDTCSDSEFFGNVRVASFDRTLLNHKYTNLEGTCCCCPRKLKKAFIASESFSDFVKAGPVALKSFNGIKDTLNYIVCLDIEAFEFDHRKILEFGIIVYDLNYRLIDSHHIIIKEHLHLSNGRHIVDNRDRFNFGTSKNMKLKDAVNFVFDYLIVPNSCLLGHNIKSDILFLRQISSMKIDLPVFDTQAVFSQYMLTQQPTSLSKMLDQLNIEYSNLHNAGNDAYYTLQAFIKLANLEE